ncbi:MAG: (2Fe-2S)-binding protein [Bdellovibrionales bacterium]|nr:(2Fe-2S)-binding protein [Bdellovibrionales bacterium]
MSSTVKKPKEKPILFLPQEIEVKADSNSTLLEVALRHRVDLNHSCGGMGSCTTCRVFVLEGIESLGPRSELELERAEERYFADNERLSCQIAALPGLVVRIPSSSTS